jgi:integrase
MQLSGPEALMVDLNLHVGLRPGELYGLRKQVFDLDSWLIWIVGVMTRSGWRQYPKTKMSFRPVPIPDHLRLPLANHLAPMRDNEVIFPAPGGGFWDDRNFARRIFDPALEATAIIDDDGTVLQAGVRRGTPYDMRHTAASWLVQDGVDLYRVQHLLGHEKYQTTQRYAHLAPTAFDPLQSSWAKHVIDPRNLVVPAHLDEPGRW